MEETKHEEMVAALVKSGHTIVNEMTASDAHLLHMAIGIAGEAGELLDAVKKAVIYRKPLDMNNVIEELGDLEFYMEGTRQGLRISRELCLQENIKKLSKRYDGLKYSDKAAQDRADKASHHIMKTQYDPGAGTHISRACKEACKIAKETGEEIRFNFNDIILTATQGMDAEELANEYSRKSEERRKAYQESEEGKRAAEKRAAEVVEKNEKVNALVFALPEILKNGDMGNLMDWLETFTVLADDIAVEINHAYIAGLLEGAGYIKDDGVGNPLDWFSNQERTGRYIIGQAISCLRMNKPPHSVTLRFVEKWRVLNCSNSDSTTY